MNSKIDKIISLIFTTRKIMYENKDSNKEKKCSFMHLIALKFIEEKKPLMNELADYLGITRPSATSLANRLLKDNFVFRNENLNDRRVVEIIISKKGKNFLELHKKNMSEKMRENLKKLTEKEQDQLEKILNKIVN